MKRILKYTIGAEDCDINTVGRNEPFTFEMIKGAEILDVQSQITIDEFGIPQNPGRIWVLVDESETEKEKRKFVLHETGQSFEVENQKYIGTYQVFNGKIVLHLFECVGAK